MNKLIIVFIAGVAGGYVLYQAFKAPEPVRYKLEQYECTKAYYQKDGKEKFKDIAIRLSFSTDAVSYDQFGVMRMLRTGEESAIKGEFTERDGKLWSPQQVTSGGLAIDLDRTNAYLTTDGVTQVTFKLDECKTIYKY